MSVELWLVSKFPIPNIL